MINLIQLWINTIKEENARIEYPTGIYPPQTAADARNFDTYTTQSSFEFTEGPPKVIFVKECRTLEPAEFYEDLPELYVTQEENSARSKLVHELKLKYPYFSDSYQMIITGVIYDDHSNTLYMEAKKVPNSFLLALDDRRFPVTSPLYMLQFFRVKVLAPIITRNGMTVLLQTALGGLYSVSSDFLRPQEEEEQRLNFDEGNLVIKAAWNEINEEIESIHKDAAEFNLKCSMPEITALSIRRTATTTIGTIEFIAPSYVDCHSSYLQKFFDIESLYDYQMLPLDSQDREPLVTALLTGPVRLPGASVYLPTVLSVTRLENQNSCMMALPRTIPNSSSIAWPLSFFKVQPGKTLSMMPEETDNPKKCSS